MSTPDQFDKNAARQKMYMVLFGALVLQVFVMVVLFASGKIEENRQVIRFLVGGELVVFALVFLYLKNKESKNRKR
tara:strand:- start:14 stop:241 length:228 start_codon:yes stop_codon:yes gene_type:complete